MNLLHLLARLHALRGLLALRGDALFFIWKTHSGVCLFLASFDLSRF